MGILEAEAATAREIEGNLEETEVQKYKATPPDLETDLIPQANALRLLTLKRISDAAAASKSTDAPANEMAPMKLERLLRLSNELREIDAQFWETATELEREFDEVLGEPSAARIRIIVDREDNNLRRLNELRPIKIVFEESRRSSMSSDA